ncbi:MAG: hypothetical protein SOZ08_05935 [Erysipelotrichaceae bacterium]|nr:hypothetical protein [Erysipelotrichaceae bacterium]
MIIGVVIIFLSGSHVQLQAEKGRFYLSVQPKEKAAGYLTIEAQSCQYRCGG